jgi:hypothetical protein
MFDTLDDTNFILYAAKHYDNPSALGEYEFDDDLSRIRYLKRLFIKYKEKNELNERLILNHITVLYNVFYHKACTRILCFRLKEYLHYLKPFLIYMSYWEDDIQPIGFNKEKIIGSEIPLDPYIVHKLRKL